MKIFKLILGLVAMICLVLLASTDNNVAAIILLAVASLRAGIMIGERAGKNGK